MKKNYKHVISEALVNELKQVQGYLKQIIISDDGTTPDFMCDTDCSGCQDKRDLAQDAIGILGAVIQQIENA